jgi:hypothetical protein
MATTRDIQTARDLRALGATLEEIAAEVGVHKDTVYRWVHPRAQGNASERQRRKRMRQREAAFNDRLVALREAGLSFAAIAGAVKVYDGRTLSGEAIKVRLSKHAPHLPKKPRGSAFGSQQDPRLVRA